MERDFRNECRELLALAGEFVQLGGQLDQVFNRPLVFLDIDETVAPGALDGVTPMKLADDFLELMRVLRAGAMKLKQDQLGVSVHGALPSPETWG
jgi:hypothetical protein